MPVWIERLLAGMWLPFSSLCVKGARAGAGWGLKADSQEGVHGLPDQAGAGGVLEGDSGGGCG
jgi:hypothetical protein